MWPDGQPLLLQILSTILTRTWNLKMKIPARMLTRRQAVAILGASGAVFAQKTASPFPKGAIIRTVLEDLPPESLAAGATLFHEHMSLAPEFLPKFMSLLTAGRGSPAPAPQPPAPGTKYFLQDLDLLTEELRAAKSEGVACLVDGGHPDMGRSLDFLKRLSTASGMPIVSGTGYYTQPFYPPEIAAMSEDQIARDLIRQANTEPYGAFGEIGTWDEIAPDERKVFRAVAKAHLATNLPIFTHTNFGKAALEQLDIFESLGVNPRRVAIGHVGGLIDPKVEVHKALCKRGAFVGFDRQGGPGDARQVPMVMALIEAGYADNLLFASDFSSAAQLKRNGGAGYAKTVTVFAPKLREAGAKEETLRQILVDNPQRFLAFVPKSRRK
jgi:phosphotriesterase-related protein